MRRGGAPTAWQKSLHPAAYQHKIEVAHEGVDTAFMAPDASARFALPGGRELKPGDPVVTFVARNLEPDLPPEVWPRFWEAGTPLAIVLGS